MECLECLDWGSDFYLFIFMKVTFGFIPFLRIEKESLFQWITFLTRCFDLFIYFNLLLCLVVCQLTIIKKDVIKLIAGFLFSFLLVSFFLYFFTFVS